MNDLQVSFGARWSQRGTKPTSFGMASARPCFPVSGADITRSILQEGSGEALFLVSLIGRKNKSLGSFDDEVHCVPYLVASVLGTVRHVSYTDCYFSPRRVIPLGVGDAGCPSSNFFGHHIRVHRRLIDPDPNTICTFCV